MWNELEEYLKSEMLDDHWYDNALFICQDIIREFTENEWNKLLLMIPMQNIQWNIRLVECLSDINSPYVINCILKLINTKNDDLFITCVDALKDMDTSLVSSDEI